MEVHFLFLSIMLTVNLCVVCILFNYNQYNEIFLKERNTAFESILKNIAV